MSVQRWTPDLHTFFVEVRRLNLMMLTKLKHWRPE